MPRRILLLLALAAPLHAQREDGLLAHWRLSADRYERGAFRAVYGQPPLRATAEPGFLGEGERQVLVLTEEGGHLESAGRLPSDVLPRKRLTVEAWVAVDRPAPRGDFLAAVEDDGDQGFGWVLGYRGDRFSFGLASEGLGRIEYLTAPHPFQPGRWYHVAGVYDGDVQQLLVDGELVAEFEEHDGPVRYRRDHLLAAGADKDSNEEQRMLGGLYELRLWSRALSERQLRNRMYELRPRMPSPAEGDTLTGYAPPAPTTVREMQPAIDEAIDRGVAWLLLRQHRDGSFESHQDGYRNGMTALALYTLLKQGVPPTHPAIVNGLDFLRRELPRKTYSAGCQLMLLSALEGHRDEDELEDWAAEIVDLLVDWEHARHPGAYSYPDGAPDLSNTQYAALGLWAASKLGVDAPRDLWQRLVLNAVERHQRDVVELEWVGEDAETRTGKRKAAGFSYRAGEGHPGTGSMTAAGLCVLGTAREVLGRKLGPRVFGPAQEAERMAFEWLAENWTVDRNPNHGGRHLYYLYGIERVGALYDTDTIGEHLWYRDGAEKLIEMQKEAGSWQNGEPTTCYALLFLSRATASSTGPGVSSAPPGWVSRDGQLHFRATGDDTLALWVTGIEQAVLDRFEDLPEDRRGLRVLRVEYLADGEVIATVEGNAEQPWKGQRFAAQHAFSSYGEHTLRARAHVVPHGAPVSNPGTPEVLESGPLQVEIRMDPKAFQQMHLADPEARLQPLPLEVSLVTASTPPENDRDHAAGRALDRRGSTRWLAAADDAFPWLRIELREPAHARAVRISPATSALHLIGSYEPVRRVKLVIDGQTEYEVGLAADGLIGTTFELDHPQRVRSLEVRILDRQEVGTRRIGLAEVEILGDPPRRRRRR